MTLLESLIAFVILALVSVSVIAVSSQSTADTAAIKTHYYAGLVADNALQQSQLTHQMLKETLTGKSQQMGRLWYWTIQPVATKQGGLQQWKIRVFANKSRELSLIERVTYVSATKE